MNSACDPQCDLQRPSLTPIFVAVDLGTSKIPPAFLFNFFTLFVLNWSLFLFWRHRRHYNTFSQRFSLIERMKLGLSVHPRESTAVCCLVNNQRNGWLSRWQFSPVAEQRLLSGINNRPVVVRAVPVNSNCWRRAKSQSAGM